MLTETANESKRKSTFCKPNWPIHFLKSFKLYNAHIFVKNHYFSDFLKKALLQAKFDTKLLLYWYVILIKDIITELSLNTKVVQLITVYFKWKKCSFSWVSSEVLHHTRYYISSCCYEDISYLYLLLQNWKKIIVPFTYLFWVLLV